MQNICPDIYWTIFTSQIKVDIAKSCLCIFFLSRERKACLMLHNILETIRHYKVITLFFSIPINIYLYFIGKLVQQIAVLPFAIVILDSFLLLYCRIDWELTRHFVWVIEEINGVVIFHLVHLLWNCILKEWWDWRCCYNTVGSNHNFKSQFSLFIYF